MTTQTNNYPALSSPIPAAVKLWLQQWPKQLAELNAFTLSLSTSSSTSPSPSYSSSSVDNSLPSSRRLRAVYVVELLRKITGTTKWFTPFSLLCLLEGIGREINNAGVCGGRDVVVENVVRRLMSVVRLEVVNSNGEKNANSTDMFGESSSLTPVPRPLSPPSPSSLSVSLSSEQSKLNLDLNKLTQQLDINTNLPKSPSVIGRTTSTPSMTSMLYGADGHLSRSVSGGSVAGVGGNDSASESEREEVEVKVITTNQLSPFSSLGGMGGGGGKHGKEKDKMSLPMNFHEPKADFKESVMEAIAEVRNELDDLHKKINEQSTLHIHANEVILTYGRSQTVELFLKAAKAKMRKFQVIVCEAAPDFGGHSMAKNLANAGIDTMVINDSEIFAIMARVNQVILPAHAVLANGGLIASSGCHLVALAAAKNSVPCVCVTAMFKLCPYYPHEGQDTMNELRQPSGVMDLTELGEGESLEDVNVLNPVHDYVPPELVDLYVTNIGGFQPSYIYRLLNEFYHPDDLVFG